jgi:hypothetical protein
MLAQTHPGDDKALASSESALSFFRARPISLTQRREGWREGCKERLARALRWPWGAGSQPAVSVPGATGLWAQDGVYL